MYWSNATTSELGVVNEFAKHTAYCCATRGKEKNIVAVNLFHEQLMGRTLPFNHSRIKAVKAGIKGH